MSLSTRILLALGLLLFGFAGVLIYIQAGRNTKLLTESRTTQHEAIVGNLLPTLGKAIFALENKVAETAVKAAFDQGNFKEAIIYSSNGDPFVGFQKPTEDSVAAIETENIPKEYKAFKFGEKISANKSTFITLPTENKYIVKKAYNLWNEQGEGEKEFQGFFVVSYDLSSVQKDVRELNKNTFMLSGVLNLIALVLCFFFIKNIVVNRINEIASSSSLLSQGKYSLVKVPKSNHELTTLARNFNGMIKEVKGSREAYERILENSKAILESGSLEQLEIATENAIYATDVADSTREQNSQQVPLNGENLPEKKSLDTLLSHIKLRSVHNAVLKVFPPAILAARDKVALVEVMQLLEKRNAEIKRILESISQGIVTFDENLKAGSESSKFFRSMFGIDSTDGTHFEDLITNKIALSGDEKSQMKAAISSFLGEPDFAFEVNSDSLPKEFRIHAKNSVRVIEADWLPLVENDTINGFMTTFRDVTTLRELKQEAEAERTRNDMILQLVSQAKNKPLQFFDTASDQISNAKNTLEKDANLSKRILHTIKGNSRAMGYKHLADSVHELESAIAYNLKTGTTATQSFDAGFENLHLVCNTYLGLLKKELLALSKISDSYSQKESLLELLQGTIQQAEEALQLSGVRLNFECDDSLVLDESVYSKISSICVHLLNNAVAHGIANQNAFEAKTVTIKLSQNEMEVQDSGPGLNLGYLEQRALTTHFPWHKEEDLAKLVFESGVSSALAVGAIAGRGVGMDAVKSDIESIDGQIVPIFREPKTAQGFRKFRWKLNWKTAS